MYACHVSGDVFRPHGYTWAGHIGLQLVCSLFHLRAPVGLQVTRHKLAEMKTEAVVGRVFADHCLALFQAGRLDPGTASMAKYWLTDLQNKIVDAGVQLHGGFGYMWEYPICKVRGGCLLFSRAGTHGSLLLCIRSQAYVDARVQKIYAGTNEIMKELISRGIAK